MIKPEVYMQRALNLADRPPHIQQQTVGVGAGDGQAVGPGKGHEGLIITGTGSESPGKLRRGQIVVIIGAPAVVNLGQKIG